ncbi:MAG TPA: diguanylate cyclase [Candidatus Coprousia avicola]|nr:diguanylate cyclase [Candidatus Coprousia avicola]
MRRSDTLGSRYRRFCARRRRFFTEDYPRVIERNFRNVRAACLMACAIAALFTPVAALCVPAWHPSVAHYALAPIALVLYGLMSVASPRLATRPWAAAAACLVVEALLLVAIGLLDTVFAAGRVGVLTQPVGIGLGVLIATPWGLPLGVLGLTDALFVALSFATKPLAAAETDLFSVCVGFVVAIAVAQLALGLRLQDFDARERYRELSERDALTGLLNRGALAAAAARLIGSDAEQASGGRSGAHASAPVSLIMVDIDAFKQVNDNYGHDAGDDLLRTMGDILQASFRATDAVGRFGGDEFMVIAPGLTDPAVARAKLARVQAAFGERGSHQVGAPVSCSCGVAVAPAGAASFERLFRAADEALYEVKRAGKGNVAVREYTEREPGEDRRRRGEGGEAVARER